MQQKLREMRITYGQLQTKTCGAEEDGDYEQNRSPIFESLQMDILSFLLMFVSTRVRDFLDTGDSCTLKPENENLLSTPERQCT